jgi:hypothetical protein
MREPQRSVIAFVGDRLPHKYSARSEALIVSARCGFNRSRETAPSAGPFVGPRTCYRFAPVTAHHEHRFQSSGDRRGSEGHRRTGFPQRAN